jgi:hypothetical protein
MAPLRPTYVWITAHLVLCSRSRFSFYRRFQDISRAGPARNRVKRCIVFRSAGLGLVSLTNIYVCTYLIMCLPLTAMLTSSMRTTIHSENVGMNDASEYRGQCFINSLIGVPEAFWFEAPILLTLYPSPNIPHLSVMLFVREVSHESVQFIHFISLWPRSIKYLRLMNYQPAGLQASRTLHLHLYAQTAELRICIESAVWAIYTEFRCISVLDMDDCIVDVPDSSLNASVGGLFTDFQQWYNKNWLVYINVALNIHRSTIYLTNTTTQPRPIFSSLQNARQTFPYTVPLVDICTCSWKTMEFMLVSASEPATSFAWYSRTLRMRRGPSTNICTIDKTLRMPTNITVPIASGFYRNDELLV